MAIEAPKVYFAGTVPAGSPAVITPALGVQFIATYVCVTFLPLGADEASITIGGAPIVMAASSPTPTLPAIVQKLIYAPFDHFTPVELVPAAGVSTTFFIAGLSWVGA